jgi:hypothetical protein
MDPSQDLRRRRLSVVHVMFTRELSTIVDSIAAITEAASVALGEKTTSTQ